jgi:NDP-sugar pyrophosphorylase family protein
LYEVSWRAAHERGALEAVAYEGPFVDCGTPAQYLQANDWARELAVGEGSLVDATAVIGATAVIDRAVVGAGAVIEGEVRSSVVWPGATVPKGDRREGDVVL